MGVLEGAWHRGDDCVDLGNFFRGAVVHLRPKLLQRTPNGSRDVRREELPGRTGVVNLFATKLGDWRIATGPGDPDAIERRITIPADVVVKISKSSEPAPASVGEINADCAFTEPTESKKWVAWISLDPRHGELHLYPKDMAAQIEHAWQSSLASIDLGHEFFGAVVVLRPQLKQNTRNGSRDVRRIEMPEAQGSISISVIHDSGWRAATRADSTGTEERTLTLGLGAAIEMRAC